MLMETRLTLRPGQSGTKKLLERYGERLVRVRYLYGHATGRPRKLTLSVVPCPLPRSLPRPWEGSMWPFSARFTSTPELFR